MAQCRQSGGGSVVPNGVELDYVSIGVGGVGSRQFHHHRQSKQRPACKISTGFCILALSFTLAFFYFLLQIKGGEVNRRQAQDNDMESDMDFLTNVTRIHKSNELKFGHGLVANGWDSRYWDKDDRRRDEDYNEEELERSHSDSLDNTVRNIDKKSYSEKSRKVLDHQGNGLYNEAERNELKMHQAEYDASLKTIGESSNRYEQSGDADEYFDDIDLEGDKIEKYDDFGHDEKNHFSAIKADMESSRVRHA